VWRSGQALLGEGLYRYDAAGHQVKWITGPYAELGYGGHFAADASGLRHKILIKDNLVASNSQR
jgi:hypothetical protein